MSTPVAPPRVGSSPRLSDVATLGMLGVFALAGFHASFGAAWIVPALAGLVVGGVVAYVSARRDTPLLLTVLSAVVAYLGVGALLALPTTGVGGIIPSFAALFVGPVRGWADLVVLDVPIAAPPYVLVIPYVTGWLLGLVSVSIAGRVLARRRTALRSAVALIPASVVFVVTVLTGTREPVLAALLGGAFAITALAWFGWPRGQRAADPVFIRSRRRGVFGILALALVLGFGLSVAVVAIPSRFVLREEVHPPFDPALYPSPLSAFRKFTKVVPDDLQFTIEGLEPGDVVRLATMDVFTGKLWNVAGSDVASEGSGAYMLATPQLPLTDFVAEGRSGEFEVVIAKYADVWVPTVGYPTSVALSGGAAARTGDLRFNPVTGSVVLISGLEPGDAYRFTATLQRVLTADELTTAEAAGVDQPVARQVPGLLVARAEEYAGEATADIDRLVAIEASLRSGYLSHGLLSDETPSLAGHGADRLTALFEANYLVGDQEQYASAFALMARELGFPARVVMGFAPKVGDGPTDVYGSDVTAWPEVALDGIGWVAFSPTPDDTDVPQDLAEVPQSKPQPQVRQPPRSTNDSNRLLSEVEIDDDSVDSPADLTWVFVLALAILGGGALFASPLLIAREVKRRRAVRRENAGHADERVAGAWDELLDRAAELGHAVPRPTQSRGAQRAVLGDPLPHPDGVDEFAALARDIDRLVFDARDIPDAEVAAVWARSRATIEALHARATPWRQRFSRVRISTRRGPGLADLTERLRSDLVLSTRRNE